MGSKSKSKQSSTSQNVSSNQGVNSGINMNYGLNQSGNFGQNSSFGGSSSVGGSAGGGSSFNQSTQGVYGAQDPYLQDVYGQAQGAFNQGMADVNGMRPEVQQQMGDALGAAGQGYGNQMGGGFASGLQGQVGPNNYVDALAGDMISDAQQIKMQNLGGLDARAAAAGMSGSSGYRDQVNSMAEDVDDRTMQGLNQLRFNAHNQGVANNMQLAGMMDSNQQNAMGNLGNIQSGAMAQFQPAMLGQQMAGNYAQAIGGPTTLTNSSGGASNFNNSFNNANSMNQSQGTNMGFSNGINIGMGMNGAMNNQYGYGTSQGNGSSSSWSFDPGSTIAGGAKLMGAMNGVPIA